MAPNKVWNTLQESNSDCDCEWKDKGIKKGDIKGKIKGFNLLPLSDEVTYKKGNMKGIRKGTHNGIHNGLVKG